jgi:DNA-binding NarL/FixJ family response regulator
MSTKILFIGHGLFCESLTRLLSENEAVEIFGAVRTCGEAKEILSAQNLDVLIVDHAQVKLKGADLEELLAFSPPALKVIYISLDDNKMVVHNRQQIAAATLPDLMSVLQIPTDEDPTP